MRVIERKTFGIDHPPLTNLVKFPLHFLFLPNGDKASNLNWYEPNFKRLYNCYNYGDEIKNAYKYFKAIHKQILKTNKYKFFQTTFGRYTEALESNDMQKVFLSLWALLEKLTFTLKDNYTTTIKRSLVCFEDKFFVKQELEILRDKRNIAVHNGEELKEAEKYACSLIKYIRRFFIFIINIMEKFNNEKDIRDFLDLPTNSNQLVQYEENLKKQLELTKQFKTLKLIIN